MVHENPPRNMAQAIDLVDSVIASAQYAFRATIHKTLNNTPGGMAFGRDMVLPIPLLMDFNQLRQKRQVLVDENNRRANLKRRFKDYEVGDEVLILLEDPAKLDPRAEGPFMVEQIHTNGTVTIERAPNIIERVNVRRLKPYHCRL